MTVTTPGRISKADQERVRELASEALDAMIRKGFGDESKARAALRAMIAILDGAPADA